MPAVDANCITETVLCSVAAVPCSTLVLEAVLKQACTPLDVLRACCLSCVASAPGERWRSIAAVLCCNRQSFELLAGGMAVTWWRHRHASFHSVTGTVDSVPLGCCHANDPDRIQLIASPPPGSVTRRTRRHLFSYSITTIASLGCYRTIDQCQLSRVTHQDRSQGGPGSARPGGRAVRPRSQPSSQSGPADG